MRRFGKLLTVVLFAAAITFALAACSTEKFDAKYDDNAAIAGNVDSYFQQNASATNTATLHKASAKVFSGVKKVCVVTLPASWSYTLNVTAGECKLVLVKDSEVTLIVEGEGSGTLSGEGLSGEYVVKLVGRQAAFSFEMTLA